MISSPILFTDKKFWCPHCRRGVAVMDYWEFTDAGNDVFWTIDVHVCTCGGKYFIQVPYHRDYLTARIDFLEPVKE